MDKRKRRPLRLISWVMITLLSGLFQKGYAQPCPAETPMYGGAQLDGSPDEYEQYFAITDDDLTRITEFRYCKCCINNKGQYEHFRGFEATIYSPSSGYQTQQFGTMDGTDPDTFCETHDFSTEELMWLTIYADSNDAEGIVWEGHEGTEWVSRANGNIGSPRERMGGRPIGFRVWMGDGGMPNQPLLISVVYNDCNCPASTFMGNNPFLDMEIEAVVGPTQTQELKYQENYMESVYGQNCGSYQIESFPSYPWFEFSITGNNLNPSGQPYTDLGTFITGSLDDIGQYPVTMRTFQDVSDTTHGYTIPFQGIMPPSEQTFLLTINPCTVQQLGSSITQPDIVYRIPEVGITQGTYEMQDMPNNCGYDQTLSVSNVPIWATHDDAAREFVVPSTTDKSRIGVYPVTIYGEIQVWDDYTKTTQTTHTHEYEFNIYIEPCLTTSITSLNFLADKTYVIGDLLGVTSDQYSFVQNPAVCDYDLTVTVTGLEAFMVHNEPLGNVQVPETQDKSLAGTYPVTVTAQVTHFTDSSMTNTVTVTEEISFNFILVDPCPDSVLQPVTILDMERSVKQAGISQQVFYSQDSISQAYGDQTGFTYCGPRAIELITDPAIYNGFMSFDPATNIITVMTNDDAHVGVYDIEARVYLEDYPMVEAFTTYQVEIKWCQVTDMQQQPVPDQVYTVYTPAIAFGAQYFTMTPLCGYDLEYTFQLKDPVTGAYLPLPSWITNIGDLNFSVDTWDPNNVGNYIISVRGSVPGLYMDPVYSEELEILLEVNNDCQLDEVTALSTIDHQLYYIDVDGLRDFDPTWSTTVPGCPSTYEIGRIVNGVERPLTPAEMSVINFSTFDGQMSYSTSDYALDGEVWEIRLYKRSTYSISPMQDGEYLFDIEFRDICWDSVLEPPQFLRPDYLFDVWQFQSIRVREMQDLSQTPGFCGGITTELMYVDGPLYDASFDMNADLFFYEKVPQIPDFYGNPQIAFEGSMDYFNMLGTHKFQLKSTLGVADTGINARGNNGLYNSVYSQEVPLVLVNPCLNSTVNADQDFYVPDLAVTLGKDEESWTFAGPSNTISEAYGNGFDKCGPIKYTFLDEDGEEFQHPMFSNQTIPTLGFADEVIFTLESYPSGIDLQVNFTLMSELISYPTSTPYLQDISLTYRECYPENFEGPFVTVDEMMVGDDGFPIDVTFPQWPCDYEQSYEVTVIDKKTGQKIVIPSFITPEGQVIIIETPDNRDIGEFEVVVCSTIYNSQNTTACMYPFDLIVVPEPSGEVYTEEPDFLIGLKNQRAKVGESLLYQPGFPINNYGYKMTVSMFLADAFRFSVYEEDLNLFKVNGDLTTKDDVGTYTITVTARLFKDDFDETYQKSFTLTIWDDPPEIPEPWFPEDPIFYEEWETPILRINKTQEFDPDRPIPYIRDLRNDGLLVIGWDRKMSPPSNYSAIEPTLVAVEEDMERKDIRFWENRRKLQDYDYTYYEVLENPAKFSYFANNDTREYEMMQLIDALEILITPDDIETGIKVNFTWDMIGFTGDWIFIQLDFENFLEVSGDIQYDTLSVTFWGTYFFKSWQEKEVLYGTTLYWPITRQINPEDNEYIGWLAEYMRPWVTLAILLVLPVATVGSLLPTWIFLNSLEIISHMILLKTLMPGNAHYFLKKWNDWRRWYDPDFWEHLQENYDFMRYALDFGSYNVVFELADYTHLMAQNMVIILIVLGLLMGIWGAVAIKDAIARLLPRQDKWWARQHSAWCQNFILRFCYEFFLEFCICIVLQMSVKDMTSFSPSFQFFSAIALWLICIGLVAFVFSLFFIGGPWISGFFLPKTALRSAWVDKRVRNPDFDGKKWLKEHPAPQIKPWGAFVITFDLSSVTKFISCGKVKQENDLPRLNLDKLHDLPEEKEELPPMTERGLLNDSDLDEKAPVYPKDDENLGKVNENTIDEEPSEKGVSSDKPTSGGKTSLRESANNKQEETYEGGEAENPVPHEHLYMKEKSWKPKDAVLTSGKNTQRQSLSKKARKEQRFRDRSEKSKLELQTWAQKEAHLRVKFQDRMKTPQGYSTLFFGLKHNHERNVAVVHPLMFLLRRVIYALVIVFMDNVMWWGVILVMFSCLFMLAYACTEWQWKERIINYQHIFDECTIYCLCLLLLCFSNMVDAATRWLIGWIFIAICFIYIVVNTIIMIYYALKLMWLYIKRVLLQCRRRQLRTDVLKQIEKLNALRLGKKEVVVEEVQEEVQEEEKAESVKETEPVEELNDSKDWFMADDVDKVFLPIDTLTGGFGAELVTITKTEVTKPVKEESSDVSSFKSSESPDYSNASKNFFAPDEISEAERYDLNILKEQEENWVEINEINLGDHKMASQENFHSKENDLLNPMPEDEPTLLKGKKLASLEQTQTLISTVNGLESGHGLMTKTDAVDLEAIEQEVGGKIGKQRSKRRLKQSQKPDIESDDDGEAKLTLKNQLTGRGELAKESPTDAVEQQAAQTVSKTIILQNKLSRQETFDKKVDQMVREHNAKLKSRRKKQEKVNPPIDGSRVATHSSENDESVLIDETPYIPKPGFEEVTSAIINLTGKGEKLFDTQPKRSHAHTTRHYRDSRTQRVSRSNSLAKSERSEQNKSDIEHLSQASEETVKLNRETSTTRQHQLRMGRFYETALKSDLESRRISGITQKTGTGDHKEHQLYLDTTLARDSETAKKLRNYQEQMATVKRRQSSSITPVGLPQDQTSKKSRRGASVDIFSNVVQKTPQAIDPNRFINSLQVKQKDLSQSVVFVKSQAKDAEPYDQNLLRSMNDGRHTSTSYHTLNKLDESKLNKNNIPAESTNDHAKVFNIGLGFIDDSRDQAKMSFHRKQQNSSLNQSSIAGTPQQSIPVGHMPQTHHRNVSVMYQKGSNMLFGRENKKGLHEHENYYQMGSIDLSNVHQLESFHGDHSLNAKKRAQSIGLDHSLDRSLHSNRNSTIDAKDLPLTVTGKNILDSIPVRDDLASLTIKEPTKTKFTYGGSIQNRRFRSTTQLDK